MDKCIEERCKLPFAHTIFSKVLSGYIVITLVMAVLTGFFSYFMIRSYTLDHTKTELLGKAETLAEVIARSSEGARFLEVEGMLELEDLVSAHFVYAGEDMRLRGGHISHTDPEFTDSIISVLDDLELINSILAGESLADMRKMEFTEKETVFAGVPVEQDGRIIGVVILYRSMHDTFMTVNGIVSAGMRAFILALCIATALAWHISCILTTPLSELRKSASRIAEGHYGERVHITAKDEIGQLGGTLNLLSTRLKDVFDVLSDEKGKLEQLLAGMTEGIVAIDRTGRVIHQNAAALEFLDLPRFQTHDSLEPQGNQRELMKALGDVLDDGGRMRISWVKTTGTVIEAIASPFYSKQGKVIGAVGVLRDISEIERLERMRRDYIANISHELRTPLTGIRGMTEPLIDGLMETEQEKLDSYTVIYQETLRLERLIGEMLDLSRLQEGRIELEMEPMEPQGLLCAAIRRVKMRAEEQGVELTSQVPEEYLQVLGNENRIIQVLTIFLDNALSFTPPGGEILVFLHKCEEKVVFGVQDTGPGIQPSDLPYIWELFYKADKSRLHTSGTGLGLSIAKLVVELMHGEVGVESEVGKGATFTFTLNVVL